MPKLLFLNSEAVGIKQVNDDALLRTVGVGTVNVDTYACVLMRA